MNPVDRELLKIYETANHLDLLLLVLAQMQLHWYAARSIRLVLNLSSRLLVFENTINLLFEVKYELKLRVSLFDKLNNCVNFLLSVGNYFRIFLDEDFLCVWHLQFLKKAYFVTNFLRLLCWTIFIYLDYNKLRLPCEVADLANSKFCDLVTLLA